MEKSLFEQMGGTYEQRADYTIPCLTLPPQEEQPIGIAEWIIFLFQSISG